MLLIVRPRGLLDETLVHRIAPCVARLCAVAAAQDGARRRPCMTSDPCLRCIAVAVPVGLPATAPAQARAKADVACRPTATTLQYDCTISSPTRAPARR